MKAFIGDCEGNAQIRVRPESETDELCVDEFLKELRNGNASVIIYFEQEPGERAMSITPRKEVSVN